MCVQRVLEGLAGPSTSIREDQRPLPTLGAGVDGGFYLGCNLDKGQGAGLGFLQLSSVIWTSPPRTFLLPLSPSLHGLTVVSPTKLAVLWGERHFNREKCHIILLREAAQAKAERGSLSRDVAGISRDYCQWWK